MSEFTCINCSVKFQNAEIQREHYKTDWHRYNLKRKVAQLPPVTAEDFTKRVLQQKSAEEQALQENQLILYCSVCRKHFNSENAYYNHLNSKKHKDCLLIGDVDDDNDVVVKTVQEIKAVNDEFEDIDSDEWEEMADNPIQSDNCIFCDHHSEDMVANIKHMSVQHSFFIPDIEYCTDVKGLLCYLAEKIVRDFICIWCNEKGRTFFSLDAIRKHMNDKGHCKMLHEGIALAEYAQFYDYSSSYPDNEEGMDIDQELDVDKISPNDDGEEFQLVLPSGAVIGHRSLLRYYKQRLNPNRVVALPNKSDRKLHKVLAEYRSLGWTSTQQELVSKKARDIHFMKRQQSKWHMKLGCKANKLQKHFREQVLM